MTVCQCVCVFVCAHDRAKGEESERKERLSDYLLLYIYCIGCLSLSLTSHSASFLMAYTQRDNGANGGSSGSSSSSKPKKEKP